MKKHEPDLPRRPGDARYDNMYLPDDEGRIDLALDIAVATGRPLLVLGPSGGGKSTLAVYAARKFERRYLEVVMTARTSTEELLYQVDMLERLADANQSDAAARARVTDVGNYLKPGVLWWALDPESAAKNGKAPHDPVGVGQQSGAAVLLIDEIDKAEPDVPDALLVPLGSLGFTIPPQGEVVRWKKTPPLVVITSNKERELSHPFMRRCIVLELNQPKRERVRKILRQHLVPEQSWVIEPVIEAAFANGNDLPADMSTAEVIDIAKASAGLSPEVELSKILELVIGRKPQMSAARP